MQTAQLSGPLGSNFLGHDIPAVPQKAADDPLRGAARDLHEQFLTQMLKASGLGEAMRGGAGGEAAALTDFAFGGIAEEMAAAQPQLTERLYAALRRNAP